MRPGGHARARRITPPLADHHVHGGAGVDLATSGAEDVRRWLAELRAAGASVVLGSLPALVPADLAAALERLRPLWEDGALAGVHLEGPFLSPARAGAQHPDALCAPDSAAGRRVRALLRAQPRGFVRTLTLAPELPGAREVAAELEAAGTVLCLGHTDAGPAEVAAALDWPRPRAAATPVATHLFNGMRPFHHRDPGPVPTLLAAARRGRLRLELVADGAHVAPELMELILEDPDLAAQTCLVSDAIAATGAPCGTVHRLGPAVVHAAPDAPRLGEPAEDGQGSKATGPEDGGRAPLAGAPHPGRGGHRPAGRGPGRGRRAARRRARAAAQPAGDARARARGRGARVGRGAAAGGAARRAGLEGRRFSGARMRTPRTGRPRSRRAGRRRRPGPRPR